ncbi:hypothetical protein CDEST_15622 [Colletotrichum destructivum]|uniref:Uncharacterized protein n=1 Tax=Colletotrichum destructivum TaxID=34406 RepID=A0AAX4J5E9_9PEZI|nr:hypothetical protein CDEST_15622 [Colletotrichum destructivum]
MASSASISTADVQEKFTEAAHIAIRDASIGERVREFQQAGFPIETAEGLEFCQRNVIEDARIRFILETLFPWCSIGIYEVYRSNPDRIYAFMTGLNSERNAVVVRLQSPGSKVVLFNGSHTLPIKGFNAPNGLLEMLEAPLKGCKQMEIDLPDGGLVLHDARVSFRSIQGYSIKFACATREEIQGWPKKKFPKALSSQAAAIETPTIGLNFKFED